MLDGMACVVQCAVTFNIVIVLYPRWVCSSKMSSDIVFDGGHKLEDILPHWVSSINTYLRKKQDF